MTLGIFALGALKLQWNGARHAAATENIANVNTPGFRTRGVGTFAETLGSALQARVDQDMSARRISTEIAGVQLREQRSASPQVLSGNTVDLEDEMKRLAEAHRDYAADSAFLKIFHRMTMSSLRTSG